MFKILTLVAAIAALSACILVPVGHGHGDRGSHEGHDDNRDGHKKKHGDDRN